MSLGTGGRGGLVNCGGSLGNWASSAAGGKLLTGLGGAAAGGGWGAAFLMTLGSFDWVDWGGGGGFLDPSAAAACALLVGSKR